MNKYLYLAICFVISIKANAQKQNLNWYFGNKAGISFTNGTPNPISNSQMVCIEGCASVSDPNTGVLLFYSDGIQVWDVNGNIMPNGSGLLSGNNTSASQGVLILPFPSKTNLYYLFTVDETSNNGSNGFRYSILDMNLNNNLGDVVQGQKNVLINSNSTERMAVTYKGDGNGYWIVIHERNNNRYKAYSIDSLGINQNPVISNVGTIHSSTPQTFGDGTMGCMKISPNGQKLAVALFGLNKIEVVNFDACTGIFSNPKTINTIDNPYGIEFSEDNSKLYFGVYNNQIFSGSIYQVDIQNFNLTPLLVGTSSSLNNQCIGALQLAPDNKIYVAINSESWLSAISSPNNSGIACDFIDKAITLTYIGLLPTTGIFGLPQKVLDPIGYSLNSNSTILVDNLCYGDTTVLKLTNINSINKITWNFGIDGITSDSSSLAIAYFSFPQPGTYNVSAIISGNCRADTIYKTIKIVDCDTTNSLCNIFFPNAFSPNNDNLNERFKCVSKCSPQIFHFSIYNRWGERVFETNNIMGGWNGNYGGSASPVGVYFYIAQYSFNGIETKSIKGDVTLLR